MKEKDLVYIVLVGDNCVTRQKVRVKSNNEIWIIHKYDSDPFPSSPHAHCYEKGLKLDLSSGDLYVTNNFVGSIGKKALVKIREKFKAKASDLELPELAL